ncbi:hypothetical protein LGT39_05650 [Demequina sp. TTPB684]|uniref:hypothetical protein n=1 Tax=unclassified Demequina TaxID=2620311 RepID=UPI001CF2AFC7|nr:MULTISPECIES: hypothetical protein [unclassified Demequina]MCB2412331.1 hypothetical protein [Demequina sp. TTPB684]UPU89474.1 hypothetical protein LGT36_005980 [Demequina sp. TMPB413]
MTRLLRVAAVAVLVGGAAAVLSSCSNDPGAIVTTTPTVPVTAEPVSSPSPTPSVTPEEELLEQIPENARGEDFQSASNFAKFFWSQYPRLFDEGEDRTSALALWEVISDEACKFCASAIQSAKDDANAGRYREGNEFTWSSEFGTGGLADDGSTYINLEGDIGGVRTLDGEGTVVDEEGGFHGTFGVRLEYARDHWVVLGAEFQADE